IVPAKTTTTLAKAVSVTTKLVTTSTTIPVTTTQPIAETTTTVGNVIGLETMADNNTPSLKGAALAGVLKFGVIHKINVTLMTTFWVLLGTFSIGILIERILNKQTDTAILGRLVAVLAIALAYTFVSNGFFFPATVIMNI
ncbi:MAG TPA: hypothetical protein PLX10_01000, partial [Candidatus Paceibacterota bacterium]|nr:hypothetical protein [Candidatus Paceibacterota bacterium]